MNTPILAPWLKTDALRGDLRPCERTARPIPCPEKHPESRLGGGR